MLIVVAVVVLVAGAAGWFLVDKLRPVRPDAQPGDDAGRAMPAGRPAQAIVRRLRQDGTSRGYAVHQCELELVVRDGDDAPLHAARARIDLPIDSLAWFVPGSVIDVAVDPDDVSRVVPAVRSTRLRRVGLDELPPVTCRGLPDHVYLKAVEREIAGAVPGRAVIGCIDIESVADSTACSTTLGLWVLPSDGEPYATTISERLAYIAVMELPLGANVPVAIDPRDRTRVVVDLDGARRELIAQTTPTADSLEAAAAALGHGGVGQVRMIDLLGGKRGVKRAARVTVRPDGGTEEDDRTDDVMLPVPEMFALLPGSPAVLRRSPDGAAADLDAVAETRALATAMALGWDDALPARA